MLNENNTTRRLFMNNISKAIGASVLLISPVALFAKNANEYTVQDVIDIILKDIPGAPFKQTVDTIKNGSASNKVTGIITTMFATIDVIHEAIKQQANFIIAHEPTFYNHEDKLDFVPNNSIVKKKMDLLNEHNITVWRFHDGIHAHKPDGVRYGLLQKTNWAQYYKPGSNVIDIPAISLEEIIHHLKSSLSIEHLLVIGNMKQQCSRIGIMPGASGGQRQIGLAEAEKPDVLIVGEVNEWETAEYIRDARLLGNNISLIVLGHALSEEAGMQWLADWLQPKLQGVTITHVPSGSPFTFA
jgi:putative NIF3 family GTP cyclohydrolase 1 type 2